ncbi:hypothetical protein COLO4_33123 [Corchorus olitorius]|uniref:Uncharacterized protein n=1 Tax=Corchorus olitorius TaxID=93759 RepID=A0A1R3GWA8_9ROSI|nr:hypothetical protein COLO4_33123 [Corchorus olitorius]
MSNRKKSSAAATAESDEVEQLLQAAQDQMLLKLSVDSHMSRVAPDYLDPDLSRRFQALRSRPSTSQSKLQQRKQSSAAPPPPQQEENKEKEKKEERESKVVVVDEELRGMLGDDLSARFAALKASLPSSAPDSTTKEAGISIEKFDGEEEQDEEDEVEKVIRWAKDAARLDPSPPSDDDDDHIVSDEDYSDDDDDFDYPRNKKKEKKESRNSKRMTFILKIVACGAFVRILTRNFITLGNNSVIRLEAVNTLETLPSGIRRIIHRG